MARTTIDIDEAACAEVMRRYGFATKRQAVNFALRTLAGGGDASVKPATLEEALSLRGSGWEGDLETLKNRRLASD